MYLWTHHKWITIFFLLTLTICNILLQRRFSMNEIIQLTVSSHIRSNGNPTTNYSINAKSQEYRPRLRQKTKRILYWTTRYEKKEKINKKIKCGSHGRQVCEIVSSQSLLNSSHALIFHGWRKDMLSTLSIVKGVPVYKPMGLPPVRFPDQYWVLFMLESPHNFREPMRCYETLFNWTWTYRTDSDVYMPYGRFERLDKPAVLQNDLALLLAKKSRTVAYISSNCSPNKPSKRMNFVKALQKHIQVDIYGKCGNLTCKNETNLGCKMDIGRYYKFYLSLENSHCQDYITEEVFQAYAAGMVPVVYGGANYDLFLPGGSYINVNSFPSAKSLANYLLYLDQNISEYTKYLKWKKTVVPHQVSFGAGYCDLCEKLHRDYPLGIRKIISNMTEWLFKNEKTNFSTCHEGVPW